MKFDPALYSSLWVFSQLITGAMYPVIETFMTGDPVLLISISGFPAKTTSVGKTLLPGVRNYNATVNKVRT